MKINSQLAISQKLLLSRGYCLSPGVLQRASANHDILEPAIRNLVPSMKVQMHSLGSPSGLVGLPLTTRKNAQPNQPKIYSEICLNREVTDAHPDKEYDQYEATVRDQIQKATQAIKGKLPQATTQFQFDPTISGYRPVEYQGITIISPPYEDAPALDTTTKETYRLIQLIQEELLNKFMANQIVRPGTNLPLIAAVPPTTFHFTLADLIYAEKYTLFMRGQPAENLFLERLEIILQAAARSAGNTALRFRLAGIIIRGGGVILIRVSPQTQSDYLNLLQFRKTIYDDPELQELGLVKSGDFFGHLTLGYLPEVFTEEQFEKALQIVADLNKKHFENKPNLYEINTDCADVRYFPNITDYNPLLIRVNFRN